MSKTTFERIILVPRIPYWLCWLLVGSVGFVVGELFIRTYEEPSYLWSRILFSLAFALIPIFNVRLAHLFGPTLRSLALLIWKDRTQAEHWIAQRQRRIFTLESWQAKVVSAAITGAGLTTVITMGLPFGSNVVDTLFLITFLILLWFCGQTLYISLDLLVTLTYLVTQPVRTPFFLRQHPAIADLQRFYSIEALGITCFYVGLVIAIWQGPYGLHPLMLLWLTLLALYPASLLCWSFLQIHQLLRSIKRSHFQVINAEVQLNQMQAMRTHHLEDLERLEKSLTIQNMIESMREWPVNLSAVATFVITLAAAIAQIVLAVARFYTS